MGEYFPKGNKKIEEVINYLKESQKRICYSRAFVAGIIKKLT